MNTLHFCYGQRTESFLIFTRFYCVCVCVYSSFNLTLPLVQHLQAKSTKRKKAENVSKFHHHLKIEDSGGDWRRLLGLVVEWFTVLHFNTAGIYAKVWWHSLFEHPLNFQPFSFIWKVFFEKIPQPKYFPFSFAFDQYAVSNA